MEIIDVLKIQNRLIDSMTPSESLSKLKQFNNELIEDIEFRSQYPILFSKEITKMLVKHGFKYEGVSHGKSWSSYHNYENRCFFRCFDGDILFYYDGYEYARIKRDEELTEHVFLGLMELSKHTDTKN